MKLKIVCFSIIISVILVSGCGKKLPPTSPDIWPPRVLNVKAEDEYHLRIFFSERIDTLTPKRLENFKIYGPYNACQMKMFQLHTMFHLLKAAMTL